MSLMILTPDDTVVVSTIAILSPSPDVDPGSPGGFSLDWATARMTPVVARITDPGPGNLYQCVVARWPLVVDEIVVFRRGAFRGQFASLSTRTVTGDHIDLSILPAGGWPSSAAIVDLVLEIDAIDAAGNLAS
jgi:hypothetical protein